MYVAFIVAIFVLYLRYSNRNDDTSVSFFTFLTTSQKKDNTKNQLQLVRDEYEIAKAENVRIQTAIKIDNIYSDLVSAISAKMTFPEIQKKLEAFRKKYNI